MDLIQLFKELSRKNKIDLSKTITFEQLLKLKNLNKLRDINEKMNRKIYNVMYSSSKESGNI